MICPLGFVQPVMTDGITLGHPRCAVPSCREPLGNNRHRFCLTHFDKHNECAVRTCFDPVVSGSKMCTNPQHRKMESLNKARSEAPFQIAKRMQRLQVSHPNNSMLEEIHKSPEEADDLEENIEWFEVEGDREEDVQMYNEHNPGGIGTDDIPLDGRHYCDHVIVMQVIYCAHFLPVAPPDDTTIDTVPRRTKTDLHRSWTHNEQTLMRSCGIMLGHTPFYNAEAVSNVLVCPVVIYFVVFGDNKLIILTGDDREDHVHTPGKKARAYHV